MACMGPWQPRSPTKPTAAVSLDADAPSWIRRPCRAEPGSPTVRVPCSIPSSQSGSGSRSIQMLPRPSISSRCGRGHATGVWRWSTNTRTGGWLTVSRSGLDPQPGGIATDQRQRSRCTIVRTPGRGHPVRERLAARRPERVKKNRRGQSGLWGYSISGDLPIVLLRSGIRPTSSWSVSWCSPRLLRRRGLKVDLVIWNEDHSGYRQVLHDQIMGLIAAAVRATSRSAGRHLRAAGPTKIADEDRILVQTVARVVLTDARGDLASQIDQRNQVNASTHRRSRQLRACRMSAASSAHTVGPRAPI